MNRSLRRTHLGIVLLLTLTALLAACGGYTSSPTTTAPTSALAGDYVGVANTVNFIGLSSNGQQIIAYICDGTPHHSITFATWFNGAVTNNAVNLTAQNGAHLVATLTAQTATGTVTLKNGQSFPFIANSVSGTTGEGIYRDEETFGGVRYLAGWIVSHQPSATSASAPWGLLSRGAILIPPPKWGGGIINEQTGALINGATTPVYNVPLSTLTVSNVGSFTPHLCRAADCTK